MHQQVILCDSHTHILSHMYVCVAHLRKAAAAAHPCGSLAGSAVRLVRDSRFN